MTGSDSEQDRADLIDLEREHLQNHVLGALDEISRAQSAADGLVQLYDVELTETTAGADVLAHLETAARALRCGGADRQTTGVRRKPMQYPDRTAREVAWAVTQRMKELNRRADDTRTAGQVSALFALQNEVDVAETAREVAGLLQANEGERVEIVEYALERANRIQRHRSGYGPG